MGEDRMKKKKMRKWQWYQSKTKKLTKWQPFLTNMAPELIVNLWHTLLKIPQMTTLTGIVILNERRKQVPIWDGLFLILHMHKMARPREISVICKIPNCICEIYNTNESQNAPEYSGSIYKSHIFSSQENFRVHLKWKIKNIWYPPSFPNRMKWAMRTLPAVVLFHSHSSLAHIFSCESTTHQFQGLQLPASAPFLPDNCRLDKPFLTLAFSMVWPFIWLECFNGFFKIHLSIQAQSVSSSSLSDFWGGGNGGGQVFNSFEVYAFSSLMKVGKR